MICTLLTSIPADIPTWGNLIPWIIGFLATLSSTIIWYILNQQNKKLDTIEERLNKMANALFLSHRAKIIQMALDANLHPALKEQCDQMVREVDSETAK